MLLANLIRLFAVSRDVLVVLGAAIRVAGAARTRTAPDNADLKTLGIDEMPSYSRI